MPSPEDFPPNVAVPDYLRGALPREANELPRRERRACSTCVHAAPSPQPGIPMQCRRHPPVVTVITLKTPAIPASVLGDMGGAIPAGEVMQALTNFPSVQADEWCSEYEPDARPTAADG